MIPFGVAPSTGIVDIAFERLAAALDRNAVARLVEGVALRKKRAAIAGRRSRSAAAARRGRSGCRRGGCARAWRAPRSGRRHGAAPRRCRYCRSGSARGTSARRASSYSRRRRSGAAIGWWNKVRSWRVSGDALVEVELAGVGALQGGDRHPEFADALLRDRNGRRANWSVQAAVDVAHGDADLAVEARGRARGCGPRARAAAAGFSRRRVTHRQLRRMRWECIPPARSPPARQTSACAIARAPPSHAPPLTPFTPSLSPLRTRAFLSA